MEKIKKFFKIERGYKFEVGDFYTFAFLLNVILIMTVGIKASWLGLAVAVVGLIIDFMTERHINSIVSHLSGIALNIYFLVVFS